MSLIENERAKLLATALNNTAVATIVTAVIGPIAGFFYGSATIPESSWFFYWVLWFLVGISLHLIAQSILGRLQE